MYEIDETDKKILFELDRNARRSVKEIAKSLRMNRDTVAYRIAQLEKNKIIEGYYTVIDYSRIGYNVLVRTYLRFQNTTLEIEDEISDYLTSKKETFTVYEIEGDWELAFGFLGKSLNDFKKFLQKFLEKYNKYIHAEKIAVFTEYIQFCKNYLVPENKRDYFFIITGNSAETKFDETDITILKLVAENAKISLLDVANNLKLTSMAVKYRINELEKKKILLGYKALIDLPKIGYNYYKVDFKIEDISRLKDFQSFAKIHPNIVFEDRTIGGSDFEFDVELKSHDEFHELINEFKRKFPGLIRDYSYYRAKKIHKYVYFPES
jgi:DNA-binding Lrp family transcriptional regulator